MGFIRPKNIGGCIMETLLKNSTMEMLREYYYDARGECRWSNTEYVRLNQEKVLA